MTPVEKERERCRIKGRKAAFTPEKWAAKLRRRAVLRTIRRQTKEGMARDLLRVAKRAKHKGVAVNLTVTDVLALWPCDEKCPVFGTPFNYNAPHGKRRNAAPSLDRLNPLGGYTLNNVRVISWRANRIKNDATLPELERLTLWMRQQQS